jgi:hypothetical protein
MSIVLQDTFGKQYSLKKKLTIGSDSSNRIVLLDSSSSPFHAEISLKKGGILVKDHESDNGVFINNNRVTDVETAVPGDTISIGKVSFSVVESEPVVEEPAPVVEELPVPPVESPVTVKSPGYVEMEDLPAEPVAIPVPVPAPVSALPVVPVLAVEIPAQTPEPIPGPVPVLEVPQAAIPDPIPAVIESPMKTGKTLNPKWILAIIGAVIILGMIGVVALVLSNSGVKDAISGVTGVSTSASDGEGPAELNLKDPVLNTVFTTSFIQKQEDQYQGVGIDGSGLTVKIVQQNMEQSAPDWANYTFYQVLFNEKVKKSSEFSILNGQVYKNAGSACSVFADTVAADHKTTNWPDSFLKSYIDGKARRVETGVKVNGVLTDKYELKLENSPFADSLTDLQAGELYRAQKGGYLVRLSMTQTWKADKWQGSATYGFAAGQPVIVKNTVDFTYYPSGKLNVIVPGVCAGKLKPVN